MSEKRIRRPAKGGQKPNNKRPPPPTEDQGEAPPSFFDNYFGTLFEAVRADDAVEEWERRRRRTAEIIPFPKAR